MNSYLMFFIALLPILWLMTSLGVLKLPAHKACSIALAVTFGLAVLVWKMPFGAATSAAVEGALIGLWPIMIVIIAAIFTYNLALHTKSMDVIKKMLSGISTDRRIQVLILAWGFGGFLESVAGYGTAVAIPASILASLGFDPLFAAVICLIANTVPTAFGAVGIPVTTLAKVTDLNVMILSSEIGIQLALFIVIIPFILVAMTSKGFSGLKGVLGITLASGLSFALPQVLAARYIGAELPALLGSICSMAVTIGMAKLFHKDKTSSEESVISFKQGYMAWLPYILIFVFIIGTSPLLPNVNHLAGAVKSSFTIYQGEGAKATSFKWLATPGTLILIATFIGGIIQGAKFSEILDVLVKTAKQLTKSTITVVSIVAMAKIMGYSGMITSIAVVMVQITGKYYPLIAPLIGMLGTFVTGSDTSSNILFGELQKQVAGNIGASPYWLAAANTSGATAGKMISPQSIAVATSATGLVGLEGKIFNQTLKFCMVYVLALGILVYFGGWLAAI
ncbi:lactate permease [Peptoclostridium litorale DSM 5388]|uniref:L-lactate permease n=1 Tax=Peptoclostridium litorale DSM 5388 TaxID=1121324 RepID=A0A069RB88_PEPLI|nr:L-lactate permease [Peptoclostridium litorale]KDR94048.1 L-lactate permease LctP [Peptoclostridium litorale DSM 5388]SIN80136.1 lactate permease [Peptoclostridium litorale DSM 5388]